MKTHPTSLSSRRIAATLGLASLIALPGIGLAADVTDGKAVTASVQAAASVTETPATEATARPHPPTVSSGGQVLALNGAGIRHQAGSRLYTAALYLSSPARSPEEALARGGARLLSVQMLQPISSGDMGALLARGLAANSPDEELTPLVSEMLELGGFIAERGQLQAGDRFQIEWAPATGTTITVFQRSQSQPVRQVFPKQDLIAPMMRIWLGATPADPALKAALLGQAT